SAVVSAVADRRPQRIVAHAATRDAAAQLDALPQHNRATSVGNTDLHPEERMARGYGSAN
ncbi:hypothetical protein ACN6LI_006390, partial [Streptomyces violaceoruber]